MASGGYVYSYSANYLLNIKMKKIFFKNLLTFERALVNMMVNGRLIGNSR